MPIAHHEAPVDTPAAFDTLARSLRGPLPRRRLIRLLAAALATSLFGISRRAAAARGTSIPPNCIYVCCDGTCDSWTMCLKCVKWPKPTTTATLTGG